MTRQRVVGDLSMTQHTVALVFREGESPESREEKYWMTRDGSRSESLTTRL
ncbi:hypothetical protein VXS29_22820 [Escherichia coli]|uniref:hypothetical protein n=1 Tax=Escherichia coli TaxID=562 RepID=UPI002E181A61|nr:hypothetical protein [Escherichia coli]